jgi:hypothetical protein
VCISTIPVHVQKVPKEAVPADLLPKKQRVVDSVPLTLNLPPPGTIPLVTAPGKSRVTPADYCFFLPLHGQSMG